LTTSSNAICERLIGTLRRELFDRLLIVNEHHLRRVLTEYLRHYNTARPHRALGEIAPAQARIRPPEINLAEHQIRRKQVLGGLTHEYQIAAGRRALLQDEAGHRHDRVFEPNRIRLPRLPGGGKPQERQNLITEQAILITPAPEPQARMAAPRAQPPSAAHVVLMLTSHLVTP
jgi:hypothetical protein